MRCDQYVGLPQEARDFLGRYEAQGPICPSCKRNMQPVLEVTGHFDGMYGEEYPLHRRTLCNGQGHADEFLQAVPWGSGPMFFIGLLIYGKDGALKETIEWSQEAIDLTVD